ncbi:MAG: PqiC family protein [Stellaceae bacterium]
MKSGHLGVLILAGIVSACGSSPPTHFYTLSTQPAPNTAGQLGYPMRTVALGEVKLPDALDRPQIARQIGPNQLEFAETDRWAGPLDDMTRRVLAADLRPLLPAGTALVTNDSSTPAQTTVAVEVSRFDADKSGRVTLDANWETLDKNAKVVGAPRQARIVEPGSGSDSAAVAATMSRAVAGLADNIAGGLGGGSIASMR